MSDYDELKAAVRSAVNENDSCIEPDYVVAVNEHVDGPTLDIWMGANGEHIAPNKVPRRCIQPALDCGWVPTGVNRLTDTNLDRRDHVRIFLRRAEDVVGNASEQSPNDVMSVDEAKEWLGDNNDFYGGVIKVDDIPNLSGCLHVYAPETTLGTVDIPHGWEAVAENKGFSFIRNE